MFISKYFLFPVLSNLKMHLFLSLMSVLSAAHARFEHATKTWNKFFTFFFFLLFLLRVILRWA